LGYSFCEILTASLDQVAESTDPEDLVLIEFSERASVSGDSTDCNCSDSCLDTEPLPGTSLPLNLDERTFEERSGAINSLLKHASVDTFLEFCTIGGTHD
jgi:hypothetical protein